MHLCALSTTYQNESKKTAQKAIIYPSSSEPQILLELISCAQLGFDVIKKATPPHTPPIQRGPSNSSILFNFLPFIANIPLPPL